MASIEGKLLLWWWFWCGNLYLGEAGNWISSPRNMQTNVLLIKVKDSRGEYFPNHCYFLSDAGVL